jgi:hypothetical protein
MKKIHIYIITGMMMSIISLYSCKKDNFLTRYPVSSLTEENFFANANDLNTYCNGLYSYLPGINTIALGDQQSDNYENNPFNKVVAGQLTLPTSASQAGWTWTYLRQVNYFLENYQKAVASQAVKNHYVGVARFFRAWFYFDMVKKFGDVPWYGSTILPNDDGDLYKARDPRQLVMDSVMSDLKFAADNINPTGPSGTITKWSALALMARVGLHEGTFRQYQGISGGQPFLKTADSAALVVMQSNNFKLYNTGNPDKDYLNLFLFYAPSDPQNTEVILGYYYSNTLHVTTALDGNMRAYGLSLTKGLMNTYLTKNGTPFTSVAGYQTEMIKDEFTNRDPRMVQTVLSPTTTYGDLIGTRVLGPAPTGYQQIKYYDPATPTYNTNYNAGIVFRYAELLLIYAEAKAELANAGAGSFTQADLDMSVNLLRDRVGMPHLLMSTAIDPVLSASYPNVSGSLQNVVLEIRRERRVELACENFRYDDLMRWKAGSLLAQQFQGMYFPGPGTYDLNGDGNPDVALVSSTPSNPISGVSYFVLGTDIHLSNGNSGNVVANPTLVKTFTDPKNYYFPLPATELLLNKNLKQNPGW